MLHLTNVIDRATGYVYVQPSNPTPPGTVRPSGDADSRAQRPNQYALFSTAVGPLTGIYSDVRDVQERWMDAREEWDAFERREWRREGETIRDSKAREEAKRISSEKEEGSSKQGSIKNRIRIRGGSKNDDTNI